jgi:hypothetical protein
MPAEADGTLPAWGFISRNPTSKGRKMTAAMNRRTMLRLMLLAFFAWMHLGCGGGGDTQAGGGIGGTGLYASSVGTVTEFGSVVVNGVTYETRNARVIVEDDLRGTGDEAVIQNLAVGMVVRVEGRLNTDGSGRAEGVFFSADLQGPVENLITLDAGTKRVVILGQAVSIDDRTLFRNTALSAISEGMVLEVSGMRMRMRPFSPPCRKDRRIAARRIR